MGKLESDHRRVNNSLNLIGTNEPGCEFTGFYWEISG